MSSDFSLEVHIKKLIGPILVTGAAGFIGANISRKLLEFRSDVFAVVHSSDSWRLNGINSENIIFVDLNDEISLKNAIMKIKPKTVFDCAAYGAYSFQTDTKKIYDTNFQSKIKLVEYLENVGINAYVHAGSSSEYGMNCQAPKELEICKPNSDYSVSKLAFSNYLNFMGNVKGFPCLNLRLYAVYGEYEDPSRLIPQAITHGLKGEFPPLVDSNISRDFVYVQDVVKAFVLAASKMNPDIYGLDVNIGTGTQTRIFELAQVCKQIFNLNSDPEFGSMPNRKWDLINWYCSPELAKSVLNWEAETSLHQGLTLTIKWIKNLNVEDLQLLTKSGDLESKDSISAVIACYKDVQAIPIMHERLTKTFQKINVDYEIIFVNDASPDKCREVIEQISAQDNHVIGVTHSRNFGSQMAFRSGMEFSTKDCVVLLDGDLQDPPELIEEFYKKWKAGHDVVFGRRVKREMPKYIEILYKSFYRLFAKFSYVDIPLDAGDFSLIDKRVVKWLLLSPERDLFLRGLRAYVGFNQVGVDYVRPERMFGKSTNNFFSNLEWAKKGIFSFSNTPLTLLTTSGVSILVLSVFAAFSTILLRLINPEIAPKGITTILISVIILGGLNLFAIGLVGEYVSKILTEVKKRPRLIRESITRNGETTKQIPDHLENLIE